MGDEGRGGGERETGVFFFKPPHCKLSTNDGGGGRGGRGKERAPAPLDIIYLTLLETRSQYLIHQKLPEDDDDDDDDGDTNNTLGSFPSLRNTTNTPQGISQP